MSFYSNSAFTNEHILITGATGGIGYVTSLALLKAGACVTVTGRNDEKLSRIKQEAHYHADASRMHVVSGDITVPNDRHRIVKEANDSFGPITGLVNSAGISGGDVVENIQEEEINEIMELNFTAQVMLSQLVFKQMKELQRGNIVNVSSLSGLRGTYGNTAYAGSKFALIGFTQSFALEAIDYGVRVNAVCPGFVDTSMAQHILEKKAAKAGISYEEQRNRTEEALPSKKITTPEEVADTILFLLTGASKNIIGESIKISGGSVMR
ncbi:SDR family NAD(P)-dependent oxidoreductase [Alkalicoccus daliensis]|uniref:3-oxoacyl-[acyl-carrier protein] reductase n=1 Tax=Alkalicoccus daliensis TaxID=745820 RepID=A0A1H0AZV7_9BACI|nr:SDR family oxidoreductase [Alkalicoccus daliensis]SDN38583.1 3-oxoacyl-[acyl-carrier protein] reductase [Alkalicoccus daliensis]